MVLSLASCSCFKQGPLEEKYDYDMTKYIELPNYKEHTVEVHLDSLQAAIDTYLRNNAIDYVVSRGDDIYVDITVYEAKVNTKEDGSTYKTKGSKIDELSKASYFVENLGSSDLPYAIETELINSTLTISDVITRTFKYDQLEDYCPESYEGKEFYFDIKIMDKRIVEGDVVDVDFRGYHIGEDGKILKGSDGKNVKPFSEGENSRFFIGSKLAIDDFENNLINATVGEEFSFYATFPDDYSEDDLKGKKVIFYATVKSVYTAPVYNDAFVKAIFPDYGTITAFEAELKKDFIMNEMFSYVLDNANILEYPKPEYNEIKESIEISEESFEEYYGYSFDTYVKNNYGMTRDEYIKSQMQTEMVYYTIAKQEGLEPTDEMLTNKKASLIDYYKVLYMEQGYAEATALSTAEEFVGNLGDVYIYENVLFDIVEDFLYENAKSKEVEKTYTSISEKIAEEAAGKTE